MPLYKVIVRGGIITEKGKPNLKQNDTLEMSKEHADSLPPDTVVELVKPEAPKKPEGK